MANVFVSKIILENKLNKPKQAALINEKDLAALINEPLPLPETYRVEEILCLRFQGTNIFRITKSSENYAE